MKRPVSIRRSLLWNLLVMIVLLTGAIMGMTVLVARHAAETLSRSLITQTLDRSEGELERFFNPVAAGLGIVESWSRAGLLDLDDPQRIRGLFLPLMARYPQVSSVMIADERGREYMLLRTSEGWSSRQTRRDDWGDRTCWLQWTDQQPEPVESWRELDYDPRDRPWFRGAIAQFDADDDPSSPMELTRQAYWTEPYTFYTTREPGITSSIAFDAGGGLRRVVGFDVLLSDISRFTTSYHVSRNGRIIVLTDDGRVIGLPRAERFMDFKEQQAALLKQPDELGLPLASDATAAFMALPEDETGPLRFRSGGQAWWANARSLFLSPERTLWIAVVVPESDLLPGMTAMRIWIVSITLLVLAGAVWRVIVLSRRYSRPIEAIAQQSDRISRLDLEPPAPIESSVKEVRRLAKAHERMRGSLQSLLKLERDLQVARQIQQGTFPNELPALSGFAIDAWSEPAEETGGDSYDVVGYQSAPAGEPVVLTVADADRAVLLMADATGHGVGPALSVSQIRAMLRMAVRMGERLPRIARHVNEQLCADLPEGRFITAWLGELNASDHTLTSFSAGQGPLLFYEAAKGACHVIGADTPPMGVMPDLDITIGEPIRMKAGDIFAVISDGIFEAANPEGKLFGTNRVVEVIRAHCGETPAQILAALRKAVDEFASEAPAADDRTAIIIRRTGRPRSPRK
jgi:serine phosphatase RsbU (regulator of sigma subunit)